MMNDGNRLTAKGWRSEEGAVLVLVLISLVALATLATAGFLMSDVENTASQNERAAATAFYTAESGLRDYLGTTRLPSAVDTFSYSSGTAVITPTKLMDLPGAGYRRLFRIKSTASHSPPEGGTAVRSVETAAIFSTENVEVSSAITSGVGWMKNGNSGKFSGDDAASSGDCPTAPSASIPGLSLPAGGYTNTGPGSPSCAPCDGDPPLDESGTGLEKLESTGIDWDGIVNGGKPIPDYSVPTDSFPNLVGSPDQWPLIYVEGDIAVDDSFNGQGILMVRGDLTMNGDFTWDGIMLIGGALISNGNQSIEGMVVTGLNLLLGETPDDSDLGNGNKTLQYHSCNIKTAMELAFGRLSEVPGSWTEDL